MRTPTIICILMLNLGYTYSQNNCDKYSGDYIPKNLIDALSYLDCTWSDVDKEEFKNKDERDAVAELHFGTGLAIRNNWGLWGRRKNSLVRYFNRHGIYHPDDISSIILVSFHRQLCNKDIAFESQIRYYKNYWKKAKEDNKNEANRKKTLDRKEFEKYKIGDTVLIRYAQGNCPQCLLLYEIQNETHSWESNEKSCIVKGVVRGKRIMKKYNFILIIEPTDICGKKMAYHGDGEKDNLIVGQRFKYNISYNNITKE